MSKKEGVLEFVPPRFSLDDVGGYDVLKAWLNKRQALFSKDALDAGIPIPKGLLLMGISGCGKSLCVKTISTLWNLPLFRLDMNAVFGTDNPESTFLRALRSVEAVAPAVLWIDEIEMGVGGLSGGRRRGDVPHLLGVSDLDAGEERAGLRGGDRQPHPASSRGDHSQGPLRPGVSSSIFPTRRSESRSSRST